MHRHMTKHPLLWSLVTAFLLLILVLAASYANLSTPLPASAIPAAYRPDVKNGKVMYDAGGCISCHRGIGPDVDKPAGGRKLKVPGDVLFPPNITPDRQTGIGAWTQIRFLNAMKRGLSPDNNHYIPAFPYTSYAWMKTKDILDLFAYLKTLPPVRNRVEKKLFRLGRFALAFWKWLALPGHEFRPVPGKSAQWNRGAYLVLGPGHCAECHTPRNGLMLLNRARWLAGGPHPAEKGKVPSLRNLIGRKRYKDADDIYNALKYGEALGYEDISSGGMGEVQENLSRLPNADLKAIAIYLASLK